MAEISILLLSFRLIFNIKGKIKSPGVSRGEHAARLPMTARCSFRGGLREFGGGFAGSSLTGISFL